MRQNDNEEHLEADRGYGEEIDRHELRQVVFQERPPRWRRRFAMTKAILLDRGFRRLMPSLGNLPWMRGKPQRGITEQILRIKALTFPGIDGRPILPR